MSGDIHRRSEVDIAVHLLIFKLIIVELGGGVGTYGTAGIQRSEDSSVESLLSFPLYVGPGVRTQITRLIGPQVPSPADHHSSTISCPGWAGLAGQ